MYLSHLLFVLVGIIYIWPWGIHEFGGLMHGLWSPGVPVCYSVIEIVDNLCRSHFKLNPVDTQENQQRIHYKKSSSL